MNRGNESRLNIKIRDRSLWSPFFRLKIALLGLNGSRMRSNLRSVTFLGAESR